MRRTWLLMTLATFTLVAGVVVGATGAGQRAAQYVQRRYGWGEVGRQAREDALWSRAIHAFHGLEGSVRAAPLGAAAYEGKTELLAQRERTLERVRAAVADLEYDEPSNRFWLDLYLAADREAARQWLREGLTDQRSSLLFKPGVPEAMQAAFTRDELTALLPELSPFAQDQLLRMNAVTVDQATLERLILARPDQAVSHEVLNQPDGQQAARAVYPRLGREAKISVLEYLAYARQGPKPDLRPFGAGETDPAVLCEIAYLTDDFPVWLSLVESNGFMAGRTPQWEWERRAVAAYPESWYARGIRAYEAVRGRAYFETDRRKEPDAYRYWEFGNNFYDCGREVDGWLAFLKEFGKHESADDAAYRLGRCYEIQGNTASALHWLAAVPTLGNADMARYAQSRVVWILDAELDEAALRALPADLPERLRPMIAYTVAVDELRTGNYAAAVHDFDAALARWEAEGVPPLGSPYGNPADFWPAVRTQREKAARLAALAAKGDWQSRYDIAAAMYHDELLFYNQLWGGGRKYYMLDAMPALEGDMDPAYSRWYRGMNNLIQAAAAFAQLKGAPAPIAEKAAYSRAISLVELAGYGLDVALYKPASEVAQEGAAALATFRRDYPNSALTKDADGSGAAAGSGAGAPLQGWPSRAGFPWYIPFRYMEPERIPPSVAAKAAELTGSGSSAAITEGDYTYVLVGAASPDKDVLLSLWDAPEGMITVTATPLTARRGTGYAVARIPATSRPVTVEYR